MKELIKIKFVLLFSVFIFMINCYCHKDNSKIDETKTDTIKSRNTFCELPINGSKKIIDTICNNIEYKFCLLNRDSIPATSFNEGENFYFYLQINNINNDSLHFDNTFLNENSGFCTVFSSNSDTIGRSYMQYIVIKIGYAAYYFFGEKRKYELSVPWNDARETWTTYYWVQKSLHQPNLGKGNYFTKLNHHFCFVRYYNKPDSLCCDTVNFKINFEIK
jgi:hypothetical protein